MNNAIPLRPADLAGGDWTEAAIRVLNERYTLKDEAGRNLETPDDVVWRVAYTVAAVDRTFGADDEQVMRIARRFYALMVRGQFMPNSPTLMNAGKTHGLQWSACYVLPIPDDLSGIFMTMHDAALIHQAAGGTGFAFSRLRPKNSRVRTTSGVSSGPVSFLRVYNAATEHVKQGASRRGANMAILRVDHPDILEFVNCKRDGGITNFNISVAITDAFILALDQGKTYPLLAQPGWPLPGGDRARGGEVLGELDAKEVWQTICAAAWATGDPGLFFIDRVNASPANAVPALQTIESSNPCVTGDAFIYTAQGLRRLDELVALGEPVSLTLDARRSGLSFSAATLPSPTGVKPTYWVHTVEGYEVRVTGDHRFMTDRGWVEAQSLVPNDRLHLLNRKGGFGATGTLEEGRIVGWVIGDGHIKDGVRKDAVLTFWGDDRALAPAFATAVNVVVEPVTKKQNPTYRIGVNRVPERNYDFIQSTRLRTVLAERWGLTGDNKIQGLPAAALRRSEAFQRGLLQGLFTTDGTVGGSAEKGGSVRLTSVSVPLLKDVQRVLLNFGIASKIYTNRHGARAQTFHGRTYACQPDHELVISRDNLRQFADEIGFMSNEKADALRSLRSSYRGRGPYRETFVARFAALEPAGNAPVYDLTEPATHSFVANGFVVHNCGEQSLPPHGSCTLGHLNLSAFVQSCQIDWDALAAAARDGVHFLDNVVEANPYTLPAIRAQALNERRIGLGVMGWADLLFTLGIPYASEEAVELAQELGRFVLSSAEQGSAALAGERGAFPWFAQSIYKDGSRRRNSNLTTIAPTGTVSIFAGCSSGIEPIFALAFQHRVKQPDGSTRVLTFTNAAVHQALATHGLDTPEILTGLERHGTLRDIPGVPEDLKALFATAHEVPVQWHVRHQAAWQRSYSESSVSKTINLPNAATVDDVARAYRLAWDTGCLGITVFRDGCKGEQVLHVGAGRSSAAALEATRAPETTLVPLVEPRPRRVKGETWEVQSPLGEVYVTLNVTVEGDPFEIFVRVGKSGTDIEAFAEALGRLMSNFLRHNRLPDRRTRLAKIVKQLSGIGGAGQIGFGVNRIRSVPDAIARALGEFLAPAEAEPFGLVNGGDGAAHVEALTPVGDMCPKCGNATFVDEEGCRKCHSCFHSEC